MPSRIGLASLLVLAVGCAGKKDAPAATPSGDAAPAPAPPSVPTDVLAELPIGLLRDEAGTLAVTHSLRETDVEVLMLGPLRASAVEVCVDYGQFADGKLGDRLCSRRRR